MRYQFKNASTGSCRPVTVRLRQYRKLQIVLSFLYIATRFYPRIQGSVLIKLTFLSNSGSDLISQKFNRTSYSNRGGVHWKNVDIDPCIEILVVQNFQKTVCKNDSPRRLKWCFSVTTEVWLPARMSQAATLHLEKKNGLKYQSADFLHQNLDNPGNKVFLLILFFNLICPSVYTQKIFQPRLNQKPYVFERGFTGKVFSNRSKNISRNEGIWTVQILGKSCVSLP